MKTPIVLGALAVAGTLAIATTCHAKDDDDITSHPPAPSTMRNASMANPPAAEARVTRSVSPNPVLLGTGLMTFGVAYVPSVIVAYTSSLDADQKLYIPVAGPWLDLFNRPSCGSRGPSCTFDTGNNVLLAVDGVAQGVGAVLTVLSFLVPEKETIQTTTAAKNTVFHPTLHVAPAGMGAGAGAGVAAFGTW